MLKAGMQREQEELVCRRRRARDLALPNVAPLPERLFVHREEAGARSHRAVQLEGTARGWVEQGPGVLGGRGQREPVILQDAQASVGIVDSEQIDVAHRTMRRRVVERLGDGRALQRQGAQPTLQQKALSARSEVELAHGADEALACCSAKTLLCRCRPRG